MGRELDPEMQAVLETMREREIPRLHTLSVEAARELLEDLFSVRDSVLDPVASVTDHTVPGPAGEIVVRVYTPETAETAVERPPTVVFCHGGGFILGSLDAYDATCRALANESGAVIASIDYRLAPEAQFPEPVKDAYAATEWIAEHAAVFGGDPDRIAIAGDSAGANLATVVALLARDRGGPELAHQVLLYPGTNHGFDTESYRENDGGYFLSKAEMKWFWDLYLPDDIHGLNPCASPLQARDLSGLPPTTMVTAEFDPLRDDGIAYAERLEAAGVTVSHHHYEGAMHGFVSMLGEPELPQARDAIVAVASDLDASFATQSV